MRGRGGLRLIRKFILSGTRDSLDILVRRLRRVLKGSPAGAFKPFRRILVSQLQQTKACLVLYNFISAVLNKTYQELAEHYETAIVPARVRAPRDKAAVERTVGIISTYILAALRNRQFLSLPELNEAIRERLESFNHKPFQKREGSRASAFAEELPFLRPLPPHPYELSVWKVASVGPNYHIAVERMNYSVPFEYIRQKVDVRITRSTIEVFYGGNRICSHRRLHGKFNQYSTVQEHMPPEHQKYVQWNGERFTHWAAKIGSCTEAAVKAIYR